MNYGVQLSASGVLTSLYRQDVLTNNLANMDSVGYKPDVAATRQRDPVRREDGVGYLPSNALLERLGGGALAARNAVDFAQGPVQDTGQPFDLAIQGDGFFVVRDESDSGKDKLRLTRDGRLATDANGRLVMASTGMPVLDQSGRVIEVRPHQPVKVDGDGRVTQNNEEIAQLRLVSPADRSRLVKQGHSLFKAPPEAFTSTTAATGTIRQNAVERANVDEIRTIMSITTASRDVDANMSLISQHDRLTERVINTLGRVV